MMELVIKELPNATLVSVAPRAELEAFHRRKIVLERRKHGAKPVRDIDLVPLATTTSGLAILRAANDRYRRDIVTPLTLRLA